MGVFQFLNCTNGTKSRNASLWLIDDGTYCYNCFIYCWRECLYLHDHNIFLINDQIFSIFYYVGNSLLENLFCKNCTTLFRSTLTSEHPLESTNLLICSWSWSKQHFCNRLKQLLNSHSVYWQILDLIL